MMATGCGDSPDIIMMIIRCGDSPDIRCCDSPDIVMMIIGSGGSNSIVAKTPPPPLRLQLRLLLFPVFVYWAAQFMN